MSFYRTRYRGSKSPSTVELEAQNNECLGEDEEEEVLGIHRQGKAKRFGPSRRNSDDGEDDDDDDASYRMGDDEDDDEESDPEVATAKALLMQGRGPGPAAPFRWATSPSSDNSTATAALRLLSPPLVVPDAPLGGQPNVHLYEPSGQVQTRPIHSDMATSLALNGAVNGANAPATPAQASVFHAVKHLPGPLMGLAMEDDGKRNTWTADEDKILASLVEKYGPKKWGIVATYLPMRNAKQCHQRWHYVLKPSISRETWTEKEDYIIYHYQRLLGNKWSHIAKYLSGRTGYAVRNRHAFLVKHYKGGKVPVPPGESLPSTAPKTNGKPIRRTNNSTMAAYARKLKKMKRQMAAVGALREFKKGGATGIEQRPMETSPAPSETIREEMEMDGSGNTHSEAMSEERLSSPATRAGGNLRVLCNHGEATGDTAPAGRTPGSAFPPSWSTSPPRSPLDLLAALPHSDLMQLPMPTPSPRTRSLFETHFPSLNSPHQAHTMPVPPPLPHVQPSLPPSSSLTIQVPPPPPPLHLRHPMEASTSPTWAAGVNMTEALGGTRFFESPQASPNPSIQPQHSSSRQGLARADDQTLSSEAHEGGKRDMEEDEMLHDGTGQEGKTGKPEEDLYEHREDAQTSNLSWHKENEKEERGPDVDGVASHKENVPRSEAVTDLKGSHGRSAETGLEEDGREEASTSIGVEVLGDEEGENEEREYGLYGLAEAAIQEANSLEEDDEGEEKSMD